MYNLFKNVFLSHISSLAHIHVRANMGRVFQHEARYACCKEVDTQHAYKASEVEKNIV